MTIDTTPCPLLTAGAMREADRQTIETLGIPGFTLMETAGRAAAAHIVPLIAPIAGRRVLCVCGKGNNAGDGFVVARILATQGARVHVVSVAGPEAMTPDAALNYRILERLRDAGGLDLRLTIAHNASAMDECADADIVVDALLGTGLGSALREPYQAMVDWMNASPAPTVALDIPTGLDSDTGQPHGRPVDATLTVTMGAAKVGLYLGEGPRVAGRVETAEIGIPAHVLLAQARTPGCAYLTTDTAIRNLLPRRAHNAYKYSVGTALVVGGSVGFTGAPVMAAEAAAAAGAGAVICASPAEAQRTIAVKLTDIMTVPLPESDGGIAAQPALRALAGSMAKARALLVGCGLGRQPDTQKFVRDLLAGANLPAVVDADGLVALAETTADIAALARGNWILTPHAGEFRRLAGEDIDLTDRIRVATAYAERWQAVLILKGMPSVVAAPGDVAYVCGTGNPLLATAGTGDVLAGLCSGFLAQGLSPLHAALCALHIGGAAADLHAERINPRAMKASDLIAHLPALFRSRFHPDT